MDILRIFEALKIFIKDEKDTVLGLFFFLFLGLAAVKYLLIEAVSSLEPYMVYISSSLSLVILAIWIYNRKIVVSDEKFSIAIAPFNVLLLNVKELSGESKRNLREGLVDYVNTALHFHKEKVGLDKYVEVIKLPSRIKPKPENIRKWVKKLGAGLIIWGDVYYDETYLYFKPRFEFSREPTNLYYNKFKRKINELDTFKIKISNSVEAKGTELAQLMNYISYLSLMFHGIEYTYNQRFQESKDCFEYALKIMRKRAFHNKTLSDIYLATRFFYARNFHKWGNYLLKEGLEEDKAFDLFEQGAQSLFYRVVEMKKMRAVDDEAKLEHSLLYGLHLLLKQGAYRKAERKLESEKKSFGKEDKYLYYLYKGLVQKNTSKAVPFFNQALKNCKNEGLCYEEIADYFFSKGKFEQSIKYFRKRLGKGEKQIYNPDLLEEDLHGKLSEAYLKELHLIQAMKEKLVRNRNKRENLKKDKKLST